MGVALSPYRVMAERPPAEALRALPVVEVRPPLVLSANATFDDEDFAVVRYVDEPGRHESPVVQPDSLDGFWNRRLVLMLLLGILTAFATVLACEILHQLR